MKVVDGVHMKHCRRCDCEHPVDQFPRQDAEPGKTGRLKQSCKRWDPGGWTPPAAPILQVVMRVGAALVPTQHKFVEVSNPDYLALFQRQGGVCYGCEFPERTVDAHGRIVPLVMYMDVSRAKPLALLCRTCSSIVALSDHEPDRLSKIANLLQRTPPMRASKPDAHVVVPLGIASGERDASAN